MTLLPDTACRSADGHLWIGGCDTVALARKYGTPLYVYDKATLCSAAQSFQSALAKRYPALSTVAYAAKAYLCVELARLWASQGVGLDVVGPGELEAALRAGVPPGKIHLHGNNKPPALLDRAVAAGVGRIVVDGWRDFDLLERMPLERAIPIWLRLAPGIDAHTHEYRKTGLLESKFGFPIATGDAERALERALGDTRLQLKGLHAHVGSQIFEVQPLVACAEALLELAARVHERHGWFPDELSPGGGWGVAYTVDQPCLSPETYIAPLCQTVVSRCRAWGLPLPHLVLEPGRSLVARAGIALYAVGGRKAIPDGSPLVFLDGGLADNPRPALYGARYTPVCATREGDALERVTLCGPFCESSDILARDVLLPVLHPGDVIATLVSGAYQMSMASAYNGFPRPAAVMVADGEA